MFDEATSALDDETEASVMAAIDRLSCSLTIIAIAHRVSTLRNCDLIVPNRRRPDRRERPHHEAIAGGWSEA